MTSKRPTRPRTAAEADPYDLYELAVQNPEHEIEFITGAFRALRGRDPLTLREDFAGTALLACQWVASDERRSSVALDIDPVPLAWGRQKHWMPLGAYRGRVTLLERDVLVGAPGPFDVAVALNFSYWIWKERAQMVRYLAGVRSTLARDGIMVLDAFGGWESQQVIEEGRSIARGIRYIWSQDAYNPVTSDFRASISFAFADGTAMSRCFSYDWRLWTLRELTDCLLDAGFASATVHWETEDEDGEGTGLFLPVAEARNDPGWLAYIVAAV